MSPIDIEACKTSKEPLNIHTKQEKSKEESLDLSGIAQETRKISSIKVSFIQHSKDVKNINKVDRSYHINISFFIKAAIINNKSSLVFVFLSSKAEVQKNN